MNTNFQNKAKADAYPLNSIVMVGGRSAIVVAPDGTNHAFKFEDSSEAIVVLDDGRKYNHAGTNGQRRSVQQ